jgi:hypothetical protein
MGKSGYAIDELCRGLSLCPRGYTVRRDDMMYNVFCCADAAHAERLRATFGAEPFDPRNRGPRRRVVPLAQELNRTEVHSPQ